VERPEDRAMLDMYIDTTIRAWHDMRDYAQRLVADLSDGDMVSQPVPGVVMNHPAWVLSHLNIYAPVLTAILRGRPFEDPKTHRFGMGSKPLADAGAYLPRQRLIDEFVTGYDEAAEALKNLTERDLAAETPLERWRPRFPRIIDLPGQFFVKHNATHLGQISAWRRAGGRPAV
jgi:hypothetical protein